MKIFSFLNEINAMNENIPVWKGIEYENIERRTKYKNTNESIVLIFKISLKIKKPVTSYVTGF